MMNRNQPVLLITGCSTGFGRELATLVLERGWRAVVTARKVEQVAAFGDRYGDRALVGPLDVTKREQQKVDLQTRDFDAWKRTTIGADFPS